MTQTEKKEKTADNVGLAERRWLRFEYDDGTYADLELGKATCVRGEVRKVVFHVDRLDDGKHLMLCAGEVWPEGKRIDCIRVMRSSELLCETCVKNVKLYCMHLQHRPENGFAMKCHSRMCNGYVDKRKQGEKG